MFTALGHKQYGITLTIPPARALIYDRTGTQLLALNKDSFAAFLLPKKVSDKRRLTKFLSTHFPSALERYKTIDAQSHFMYIKRKLSDAQIKLIQEANLPEVQLLREPSRFYPVEAAAPLIGFTDIDNNGLCGIELYYNERLAGKPSTVWLEHDARAGHFYFKKETKVAGKSGEPITLTIDSNLQFLAAEELSETIKQFDAKSGAALVMDPATGQIFAAVTLPAFDPNNPEHINVDLTKNKVVTEAYELGSVIKVLAALAALDEKVVTENELIDCQNVKTAYVEGRKINTVPSSVAGIIPFTEVIEKSNNIGTAKVAMRVGTKIYDHYTRLGFGKKTGIEFSGEHKGFVNHPDNWSKQSIISLSYGYEISATLLQLGQAFCLIARDGYPVKPTCILFPAPQRSDAPPKRLYSHETMEVMRRILENTTLRGTAKKAGIKGYRVMSKTGTANLLVNGQYESTKNIFTCAGIIEKDDYQRVIVVFIKEAQKKNLYASTVAAPLFERIAEKTLIYDKII